jgi:2,3-diaminopropionate biosynthesis protein SbnB
MRYLNTSDIRSIAIEWEEVADVVCDAVYSMAKGDFAQPVKPYLRYRDATNRIIAMPAFIGGAVGMAGIKWIASFPGNVSKGLKRAHSVTVLNEAATGVPVCVINSPLISGIRTAAVSGLIIRKVLSCRPEAKKLTVGICGFGPIGQIHLEMIMAMLGQRMQVCKLYDINGVSREAIRQEYQDRITICDNFQECYSDSDIFITATVAREPYIHQMPKPGSLLLNVSLRDYKPVFRKYVSRILVDNWEEVCRENTDIENMSKMEGLAKEDTLDLADIFPHNKLESLSPEDTIMFNPMGMAIFDIAVGNYYYKKAIANHVGRELVGD